MGVDDTRGGHPPSAGDGPARWLQIQDDLLRGLAHALAGRVGLVAGVAELLGVSAPPAPHMIDALRGEAERLETLLRLLRALPRQRGEAEPVALSEALALAEALAAHHPSLDGRTLRVTRPSAPAVFRAPPDAAVRALCVALVAAATGPRGEVAVEVEPLETGGGGVAVTVRAVEGEAGATIEDLAALRWLMAKAPGTVVEGVAGGARLRLPP